MEFTLHLSSLVVLVGFGVSITLGFLLPLAPWGNRQANCLLSVMLLLPAGLSLIRLFNNEGFILPQLITLTSLDFCFGPLIYLFTRTLCGLAPLNWRRDCLHLIPVVFFALLWQWQINGVDLAVAAQGCGSLSDCDFFYRTRFLHRVALLASTAIYCVISLGLIRPYIRRIKSEYSSIEAISLHWLRWLLSSVIALVAVGFAIEVWRLISADHQLNTWGLVAYFPLLISSLVAVLAFSQHNVKLDADLGQPLGAKADGHSSTGDKIKYRSSALGEGENQAIWQQLQRLLAEDKPYLNAHLKIADLADMLGVHTNHLSESINSQTGRSFYDCINRCRVEEATRLLADDSMAYLSVGDIAYQAGFNSSSTFFTHFKQNTGMTPNQYRKKKLV